MGEPHHDLVAEGDQVLDRVMVIKEGAAQHGHDSFHPGRSAGDVRRRRRIVIDRIGGDQLVGEVQVSFVEDLFVQLNNDGFVCFGWHGSTSFLSHKSVQALRLASLMAQNREQQPYGCCYKCSGSWRSSPGKTPTDSPRFSLQAACDMLYRIPEIARSVIGTRGFYEQ